MVDLQKIAFICHPYHRGGVTRWMADAAIAFDQKGWEVYFITVEPVKEFYSAKGRETLIQLLHRSSNSVRIISTPVSYEFEFGTPLYREFIYKKLLVQIPAGTPLILSDDSVVWQSATFLCRYCPVIGVLHADEEHYYKLAEQYHSKISVFTCVSSRVQNKVRVRIPGFNAGNIFTIPCGINLPEHLNGPDSASLLRLAYVGRVSKYQKRAGDLALICAELVKRDIRFHLSIIGDGDAKAPLQQVVNEGNISEYVTFYGWLTQKEVAEHLAGTDILLMTSDFEGTPIAMMEALAAGCGMVGTRVSGIEDYEHHPLAANCLKVYETGDISAAADKIIALSVVPSADRSNAARQLARQEFSMAVCLDRYTVAIAKTSRKYNEDPIGEEMPFLHNIYSHFLACIRKIRTRS